MSSLTSTGENLEGIRPRRDIEVMLRGRYPQMTRSMSERIAKRHRTEAAAIADAEARLAVLQRPDWAALAYRRDRRGQYECGHGDSTFVAALSKNPQWKRGAK